MASPIFAICSAVRTKTLGKLNGIVKFTFPDRYFRGIDTTGRVLAVSTDYLHGKSPALVVFAKANMLGKEISLALALSSGKSREVIIRELDGRQNLVVKIKLSKIEASFPIRFSFRFAFPELLPKSPDPKDIPTVPPDFSFQPDSPPVQRTGYLLMAEMEYLFHLTDKMRSIWDLNKFHLPGIDPDRIIDGAAGSLVRSREARLERLIAWQLLLPEDADNILMRSKKVNAERITLMLMWLTAEHIALGNLSPNQTTTLATKLIPHYYLQYLAETYGVSLAKARHFAVISLSNPEEALKKALTKANGPAETCKDK